MIPSVTECLATIEEYEMLPNIRAHSLKVEKVAVLIAQAHLLKGLRLSKEKIIAGALLHDIAKTYCLRNGGDHAAMGRDICVKKQFYEIADIVAEHVTLKDFNPQGPLQEKEIVYYADKRVKHDAVVSLVERRDYILDRYGGSDEMIRRRIMENFALGSEVEKKIFAGLELLPEELACGTAGTRP